MSNEDRLRARMIGLNIRALRREQGMTQDRLAEKVVQAARADDFDIALDRASVASWESGRREPALRYRPYIAEVLETSPRVLFIADGIPT